VWQDTTSGDFTVASSIGNSLYTGNHAPGAASGLALVGSNMGTITGALTGAQIATAVWTDTTAGDFTTAVSIGKSIMNGVSLGTGLTINSYTGNTVQTGDAYARLGAPAGASVSADVAAIKGDTGTILTDVNTGAGAIYTRLGAPAGASMAADIAAVKSDTGTTLTDVAALPSAATNATTLLDQAAGVENNITLRQGLRLMLAAMAGKASGMATTTAVIRDTNDSVNRITATVDANGDRTAVTYNLS
jgi:hypothetical protein